MEKDFHYYLVYAMARLAQCERAEVIAHASQFVDDNNEKWFSLDLDEFFYPEKIQHNGGPYVPVKTQVMSIHSLTHLGQQYIYLPFHFLPGDSDQFAIKGKTNLYNTTPNSRNARAVLTAALRSGNPYRIGIALHVFADTWSHQNFTGFRESWNSVYPWYHLVRSYAPNIGHAEVGHSPDVISETWIDHRLDKSRRQIDNRERAFEAVQEIYAALRAHTSLGPTWNEVQADLRAIVDAADYDDRRDSIKSLVQERGLGAVPKYDEDRWFAQALEKRGLEFVARPGFEESDWYHFNQAAKAHLAQVMALVQEL